MSNYEKTNDYISNLDEFQGWKRPDSSIFIDEVYKVASVLLTEDYYKAIGPIKQKPGFSPAIDTPGIRKYINVDDNWRYAGEVNDDDNVAKEAVELYNKYYEIIRQKDISNIFTSRELREIIPDFIDAEIENLIKNPEQMNNLDKDIDDFIVNLNIRLNS